MNRLFTLTICFLILILTKASAKDSIPQLLSKLKKVPKQEKITIYQDLAWEYKNVDLDSSIYFIEKAYKAFYPQNQISEKLETLMVYGTIEKNKGNYKRASELFFEALELGNSSNPPLDVSTVFFNLSNLYGVLEDQEKAISSYLHGISLLPPAKRSPNKLVGHYLSAANLYFEISDLDSANLWIDKAMKLVPEVTEKESLSSLYNSVAFGFYHNDEVDSAIYYFQKSLHIYREMGDLKWEGMSQLYLGGIYLNELDQAQHAIDTFFRPALALFRQIQNNSQILETYDWLANAYEEISYDSAYDYLGLYIDLDDKLKESEKLDRIQELETKYETAKIAEREASISNQRNGFLALSILLALIILSFAFQYQRVRIKRVLENQESEEQKQQLLERLKNQEISSMNAMMEVQGHERQRIAADLHDRVGSLLATLKVNYEAMEDKIQEMAPPLGDNFIKTNKILDQACKDVRAISHDINRGVLTQFGLVPAIEEIKEAIERSGKLAIHLDAFGIDERLESTQEIFLYRIIQETITNVIKHAEASEIDIQLSRNEEEISLIIEDNGKGFDPESIKDKNEGMGLNNLKMRVEQLGGAFTIDSMPGKGSLIMVDIPVNHKKRVTS